MTTRATPKKGDALPERRFKPGNVELFLYNAVLWNAHRIHYDEPYAKEVEGYPGLVVQGPLMGDWMSQCVMEWLGDDGVLCEFHYSNRAAAYLEEELVVGGSVTDVAADGAISVELSVKNLDGELKAPGTALVRLTGNAS